jgi:transposase
MGNQAGVKRDFKALDRRRLQAARLLSQVLREAEVAHRVGVHRQSVNRWQRQLAESGPSALRRAGRAGRKPQLQASDLRRIEAGLKRGPQTLGYATGLWTTRRVVELIEQVSRARYTTVHAWRILRQLQWSCQRPVGRALERDEVAIRRWKKERWPELKKKPENGGKPSSSLTKAG